MGNSGNPFMDSFKMFSDNSMFNVNKMMPMFDVNSMINMQRRYAETISVANQAMNEGVQAIMRRNAEIMQAGAADTFQFVKEMAISPNLETGAAKQAAFAKNNFDSVMANTREMADMIVKTNMEVFDVYSKKMSENFADCSRTMCNNKKKAA